MLLRQLAVTFLIAVVVVVTPACKPTSTPPAPVVPTTGIDLAGMDKSVAPGDDFNAYVNGGWIKATPIPPDKPSYGIFAILADETRKRTVSLIQESANAAVGTNPDAQKTGDFYLSFMDEAAIEGKGISPLKSEFDAIAAIKDRRQLAETIGGHLRADVDPLNNTNFETDNLFGVWISQGLTDPEHNVPYLLQGGLGMPDRDYYLSKTPQMAELRKQYQDHMAAMFKLTGFADAATR